jgi:transposase
MGSLTGNDPSSSFRRIATRYDKLAAHDLAFLKLASIRIWLGVYASTP